MLTDNAIRSAAAALHQAEKSRQQTRMVSLLNPGITLSDAYAIQRAWMQIKYGEGRTRIGRKIGLTSRVMQASLNINEPDHGVLLDDMVFADGGEVPTSRFIATRIEAELAFVLKKPLKGPNCTIFDVLNATDYVVPALEILDTRIFRVDPETKAIRTVFDTIADNAANAGIVIGGRPMLPNTIDMRWAGAIVSKNAMVEETGLAAAVLNHPANGIVWLLRNLAAYDEGLEAGEIVLAGSFIRPIEAGKGDTISADYGPYGTVSCYFA